MKPLLLLISFYFFSVAAMLAQVEYDFESDTFEWRSDVPQLWSVSNEQAASGTQSLKFTVDGNYAISPGLLSIDTKHTISKVRTAEYTDQQVVIASSYEGTVMAVSYDGVVLWQNKLSGFYNHDVWCADLTGDGNDEVLLANADGSVYCLDHTGELLWSYRRNEAPMNAVTVIHLNNKPYVVCGGYDMSYYYLSATGRFLKEIKSSTYSQEKTWGDGVVPPKFIHMTNFLRVFKTDKGEERLAMFGDINQNSASGGLYLFEPLANAPYQYVKYSTASSIGEVVIADFNNDGYDDILMGTSNMIHDSRFITLDISAENDDFEQQTFVPNDYNKLFDRFGYRVGQPNLFTIDGESKIVMLFGSMLFVMPIDFDEEKMEIVRSTYSYNDAWKIPGTNKLLLASAQSGGSAVHVLDMDDANWKTAYTEIAPPGKIQRIIDNTANARQLLADYDETQRPVDSKTVYFMTEVRTGVDDIIDDISSKYDSPQFLNGYHYSHCEDWDRSELSSEKYQNKRDGRKKYDYTQQQALDMLVPLYDDTCGVSYWAGHGNDPLFFSLDTRKKILDASNGKKTVLIFPELEAHDADFASVLEEHFLPLAEYCREKNANIAIRTKHTFWQGIAHMPLWELMRSGEYADVFVPSMEETTDKSMDLSVPARMGFWMSGATNSWGARCARDNTSFNRLRQHSHQMLPNHFLRQMVYNVANGSQYLNNFAVDQEYFSILYELIAKDVLYVPKRSELLSISPVHLSMINPDDYYLNEGSNTKWTIFYDEQKEADNKLVFSHLNGTWPAAPVTEWDFSSYACGVKERRLEFLPPNPNGLVLITPVEAPHFVGDMGARQLIADQLHPIYKDIMTEYITDGRNYIASDSSETYPAETYYTTIASEIESKSAYLPLTVEGDVAWVVAQTSPTNLRLTLVDGGYINPDDREVVVRFGSVVPTNMVDLLDETSFDISDTDAVKVTVPCGLFRFIDIEISEPL